MSADSASSGAQTRGSKRSDDVSTVDLSEKELGRFVRPRRRGHPSEVSGEAGSVSAVEPLRQLRSDDVSTFLRIAATSSRAHAPGVDRLDQLDQLDGVEGGGNAGTNVAATLEAIAAALPERGSLTEIAAVLDRGAAMSVGVAGHLVAEFLAGVGELCRNNDSLDGVRLAMGFEVGAERVAAVIGDPRPGGMPGVIADVADKALQLSDDELALPDLIIAVADAGLDALEATPLLWEPLADAGVVDAGSAAFLVLIDALVATVHGDDPEPPAWEFPEDLDPELDASERFRYVVALDLDGPADALELLTAAWRALGDEVEMSAEPHGDGVRVAAQIETDVIGPTIEAAINIGRPHNISVADTRA